MACMKDEANSEHFAVPPLSFPVFFFKMRNENDYLTKSTISDPVVES